MERDAAVICQVPALTWRGDLYGSVIQLNVVKTLYKSYNCTLPALTVASRHFGVLFSQYSSDCP